MLKSVFIFLNLILQPHLNEYVWLHYTDRRTGDQNHKKHIKTKKWELSSQFLILKSDAIYTL